MSDLTFIPDAVVSIEILLKDPHYSTDDPATGERTVTPMTDWMDWRPADRADEETCEHGDTLCSRCLDEWACDWWVRYTLADGRTVTPNAAPGYEELS